MDIMFGGDHDAEAAGPIDPVVIPIDGPDSIPTLLLRPAGVGPWPAAVLLHGAGGRKEDNLVDARTLARRGVAVALLDLRGHGERATRTSDATDGRIPIVDYLRACDGSAEDVLRVVARLRADAELCTGRVGVLGASMGGQVALLAAIREPTLDPVALLSPTIHELPIDPARYPSAAGREDELRAVAARVDILGRCAALPPRRIAIAHGTHDPITPFSAVRRLVDLLAPEYRDRPDRLLLIAHPGGHGSPDRVIDQLLAWIAALCQTPDP